MALSAKQSGFGSVTGVPDGTVPGEGAATLFNKVGVGRLRSDPACGRIRTDGRSICRRES